MGRRALTAAVLVLACLVAGACASISKKECLRGDWQTIGYQDGSNGYRADTILSHAKVCDKHGIQVNAQEYNTGYQAGLKMFCVPLKGESLGRRGQDYSGACPRNLESAFINGYVTGLRWKRRDLLREQDRLLSELSFERLRLARIRDDEDPEKIRKEIERIQNAIDTNENMGERIREKIERWTRD